MISRARTATSGNFQQSTSAYSDDVTIDAGPLGLNVIYTPDQARKADIVFVHGLGGSSKWTWSKDRDPHLFWPLTFLPLEPDLCLTRILTFGYDASFRKSTGLATSVLDFAKDLLFDLKYAKDASLEDLNMGEEVSAYGLLDICYISTKLMTQAYMQGQHDPEYEAIIKAVRAIAFIATPHRGTNLAQTLNRILDTTVLINSKQYVADLIKNSPTLQKLNEQFRHIAPKLDIVSFYETQPTSFGIKSARLVSCPMSNQPIRSLLGLSDLPNTDYIFFRDRWTEGTCSWITHHENFIEWRKSTDQEPRILWLNGEAATGKSVAASFIVNELVGHGTQCQYFFIRYGDRFKCTPSLLLRSLAFQCAQTLPGLMEKLTNLLDEALDFESADPRIIWDRIFKSTIFRIDKSCPIYWVIDGIDESEDPQALVKLLLDIPSSLSVPLRILATSRHNSEISSACENPRPHLQLSKIQFEGHIDDLRQHVRAELRLSGTDEFRRDVEQRIIEKSQNNFLWVALAVSKVNQCHISTDVDSVLEDFPTGMEALYDRMASTVSELANDKHKNLAVRIIQCIACVLRALSIEELLQALGDYARGVLDLPRTILDLCGGFVVTDNDGKVAMVHQTARDYLLEGDATRRPFHINRQAAHKQLLIDGLRCLMSNNLRIGLARGQKLGFEQYAAEFWTVHLVHTTPDDEECASILRKFLTGRWSLTWIHILALSGQLRALVRSSKNLSRYASKGTEQDTKAAIPEHEFLENWAVDMVRIPGKFGQVLRRKPDLIYNFVPPFCPKSSPIYQQFGKRDGLTVGGLLAEKWDDLVARMPTGNAMSSLIDATGSVVAILNAAGSLQIHDSSDFRQLPESPLEHGERVTKMQLNRTATLAATYGYLTLKVWDVQSGKCVFRIGSIESKTRPLAMHFSEDNSTLIVGTDDRRVRSVALGDNQPIWRILAELDEQEIEGRFANSASHMAISRDGSMVVVGYRRYPVSAWELDGPIHIGHCHRTNEDTTIREVKDLTWHPQHAEIYGLNFEGTVFRWAPYEDLVEEVPTGATKLCLSKDGELLATGDSHGRIKLYATDGFVLLYQLTSQYSVFGLAFSPDSQRLYDVRGYHANAWEPTALAKFKASSGTHTDLSSEYDASLSTGISIANLPAVDPITALSTSSTSHFVCSGTAKGAVNLHDVRSARVQTIYTSRSKFTVSHITWDDDGKLLCFADASKQITVMDIISVPDKIEWVAEQKAVIPIRKWTKQPISQLLFRKASDILLICTATELHAVSVESSDVINTAKIQGSGIHFWIRHPTDDTLILGLGIAGLRVFNWNLKELVQCDFMVCTEKSSEFDSISSLLITKAFASKDNKHLVLHLVHPKKHSSPHLFFVDASEIPTSKTTTSDGTCPIQLQPFDTDISSNILNPLSFLPGDRLIFVSNVFSICLIQELFALPGDWISQDSLSISKIMAREKSFVCPRNGEVAVVKCSALV
ncbi:hypothetical protein F5Y08DRAFT_329875 [Xylaria arbuscula]|nr:hypothetical protein F5Y08DRAFT_329875 [Xylaria arbuscula]